MVQVHAKALNTEKARALTCDDVQVSIFGFVVRMLRVFAAVFVDVRLVLNQLVLSTEADVTVGMELRDMSREVFNMHCTSCLAGDDDGRFKVDIWR